MVNPRRSAGDVVVAVETADVLYRLAQVSRHASVLASSAETDSSVCCSAFAPSRCLLVGPEWVKRWTHSGPTLGP